MIRSYNKRHRLGHGERLGSPGFAPHLDRGDAIEKLFAALPRLRQRNAMDRAEPHFPLPAATSKTEYPCTYPNIATLVHTHV